jgi:hypothetical protein
MSIFKKEATAVIDSAGGLAERIGSAFDKNFTSDEERLNARNTAMSELYKFIHDADVLKQNIIIAEASGSWMQRNWRPLLMLTFGFIIFCTWFLFPIINIFAKNADLSQLIINLQDATQFWDVVSLGLGGYMIGRSAEKITDSIGKNMSISIGKK